MSVVQHIAGIINSMNVGQKLVLDRHDLQDIPSNLITGEPAFNQIMSKVVGGSWEFKINENPENGNIVLERIISDGKMRYVDFDREHLFVRNMDGTFQNVESHL